MPPIELHPEHRARERLGDLSFHLDLLFFVRHRLSYLRTKTRRGGPPRTDHGTKPAFLRGFAVVRIRGGPSSVTAAGCSEWAASEPSAGRVGHSSAWGETYRPPAPLIRAVPRGLPR